MTDVELSTALRKEQTRLNFRRIDACAFLGCADSTYDGMVNLMPRKRKPETLAKMRAFLEKMRGVADPAEALPAPNKRDYHAIRKGREIPALPEDAQPLRNSVRPNYTAVHKIKDYGCDHILGACLNYAESLDWYGYKCTGCPKANLPASMTRTAT